MYNANIQSIMEIRDDKGNKNIKKLNYQQRNKEIKINIDDNGNRKQYNLTTDDVNAMMDNLNSSNLEERLLKLGQVIATKKTRKHKTKTHKTKTHKTKTHKKHRKTRKDKGKHHKKRSVRSRTPTPHPKKL